MTARQTAASGRPSTALVTARATLATAGASAAGPVVPDVAAMNGNDRIRLLSWLCDNHPETVAAGVAALAAEVAARREAERIRRNRKSTLRWRASGRGAAG